MAPVSSGPPCSSPLDERGAVATEYVIVATVIAIVVSLAASAVAAQVTPLFRQAVALL